MDWLPLDLDRWATRVREETGLRVAPRDSPEPIGKICGRLNNIARQLALPTGDTLSATFAWPGPR